MSKQRVTTGVSMGVMIPSAEPVVLDGYCPTCARSVRVKSKGFIGTKYKINVKCKCNTKFNLIAEAKRLDA